jgi:hypothetical protein
MKAAQKVVNREEKSLLARQCDGKVLFFVLVNLRLRFPSIENETIRLEHSNLMAKAISINLCCVDDLVFEFCN